MVGAKELRVGNLVYDSNGFVHQVTTISQGGSLKIRELYLDTQHKNSGISKIRHIPITEEWLLKFGFENTQIGVFKKTVIVRGSINIHISKKRLNVELGTTGGYLFGNPNIQYIHQLQNLYYALTGKELELK